MVGKQYGEYFIACDYCGATDGPFDTFQDAVDAKKDLGFTSKKEDEEWVDVCERCAKED